VFVLSEAMSAARWGGFALVWLALVVLTAEALAHRRRILRRVAEPAAHPIP
jgi:chloramphenicol-sensitive protein RarD